MSGKKLNVHADNAQKAIIDLLVTLNAETRLLNANVRKLYSSDFSDDELLDELKLDAKIRQEERAALIEGLNWNYEDS